MRSSPILPVFVADPAECASAQKLFCAQVSTGHMVNVSWMSDSRMSVRIVQDYCANHWARKITGHAKSLGTQSTLGQWKVTRVLVAIRQ